MGDFRYDTVPRKIKQVLCYSGDIPYRYILEGYPQVAYTEYELLPAKEIEEEWEVKEIIGRKSTKGIIYYKIWWKFYNKSESTWEKQSSLIKSIPELIEQYDKNHHILK